MTGRPADPRAVRFDQLAARIYEGVAVSLHIGGAAEASALAWHAEHAARSASIFMAVMRNYDPVSGEPTAHAGLPRDEEDQP